jgi:C4-dicarboxylate-specific signal transduction histidine kinase
MSELTQLNRMAAAGELSATIAHEVNNPLMGIVTRANAGRTVGVDLSKAARQCE